MMKKISNGVVLVLFFLQGCAGLNAGSIQRENVVKRDVDSVISELAQKGIGCSSKGIVKGYSGNQVGAVNCGIKEKTLICPKSYGIYLSYDLSTNKVTSLLKDDQTNCF